jgi:hypothetical protein
MAESGLSLGKFLSSDRAPALTDEELVRLLEAEELERLRALDRLESEGPLHPGRATWSPVGNTEDFLAEKASAQEEVANGSKNR